MPSVRRTTALEKKIAMAKKKQLSARVLAKKSAPQSEFSQLKKRRPFTVFLVIDDREFRESLAAVLRKQHIEVRDYMTPMEFYRDYRKPTPGVLITEIHLRGMTGIELFAKLTAEKNDLLVAFLAGHADAPLAIKGLKAGAIDFLVKPAREESLTGLVARAYAIYYDVDWDFAGEDLDDIETSINRTTPREKEVLDLIVEGHSSRAIGELLGIAAKTVEAHRASINEKMRADDLPHLMRMVIAYNEEIQG